MTDHQDPYTAPLPTPAAGPRMLHVAVHSIAPMPNPNPKMSVPAFVRFEINALEVL